MSRWDTEAEIALEVLEKIATGAQRSYCDRTKWPRLKPRSRREVTLYPAYSVEPALRGMEKRLFPWVAESAVIRDDDEERANRSLDRQGARGDSQVSPLAPSSFRG